jgi:hypothetical protein
MMQNMTGSLEATLKGKPVIIQLTTGNTFVDILLAVVFTAIVAVLLYHLVKISESVKRYDDKNI